MKKRILAAGILMLIFIVTACGNDELVETPVVTDISVDENGNPLEGYETWAIAPDYKSTLITSSSIRYLSVTAGSGLRSQSDLVLPFRDSRPGLLAPLLTIRTLQMHPALMLPLLPLRKWMATISTAPKSRI